MEGPLHPHHRAYPEAPERAYELNLEAARHHSSDLIICDDLAYVAKDQGKPSVLFELIGPR